MSCSRPHLLAPLAHLTVLLAVSPAGAEECNGPDDDRNGLTDELEVTHSTICGTAIADFTTSDDGGSGYTPHTETFSNCAVTVAAPSRWPCPGPPHPRRRR